MVHGGFPVAQTTSENIGNHKRKGDERRDDLLSIYKVLF